MDDVPTCDDDKCPVRHGCARWPYSEVNLNAPTVVDARGCTRYLPHTGYATVIVRDVAHVFPCDDDRLHQVTTECWCGPVAEPDAPDIYVHRSAQRRAADAAAQDEHEHS